jgi:diketogulonate reductase-like aldo/keto reductase
VLCINTSLRLGESAVVLPKSVHEEYIVENQDIFSFSLSDEDMASLNSLDRGHHFCWSAENVL